jgi:ligand-binding SRPBCC domain-containing protein
MKAGTINSMTQRFETSQWVAYPVELVFAFFANPANLPHLMPPELKTRIEDARLTPPPPRPLNPDPTRRFSAVAAGVGSEIIITFCPLRWVPKRIGWTARITEFVWNDHFSDEQVIGPFSSFRHRHGIEPQTRDGVEGTLVSDAIEFALPFGPFSGLASAILRRQLTRQFAHRQDRLPAILAAAGRQAVRRA